MKTVLLITSEPVHRKLYEPELKKHFSVEFSEKANGWSGKADAIVYDIPTVRPSDDFGCLKSTDIPVVVLTCPTTVRVPGIAKCQILSYPVKPSQIVNALAELGVTPEKSD